MTYKRILSILNEPGAVAGVEIRLPVDTTGFRLRAVDAAGVPIAFTVTLHDAKDKLLHFPAAEWMTEEDLGLFDDLVLLVASAAASIVEVRVWGC